MHRRAQVAWPQWGDESGARHCSSCQRSCLAYRKCSMRAHVLNSKSFGLLDDTDSALQQERSILRQLKLYSVGNGSRTLVCSSTVAISKRYVWEDQAQNYVRLTDVDPGGWASPAGKIVQIHLLFRIKRQKWHARVANLSILMSVTDYSLGSRVVDDKSYLTDSWRSSVGGRENEVQLTLKSKKNTRSNPPSMD